MAQRRRGAERPMLLLTHGRDQAKTDPVAMRTAWTAALRAGLAKAGLADAATIEVDLAFYGDLWKKPAERGDRRFERPSALQQEVARDLLRARGKPAERGGWTTLQKLLDDVDEVFHSGDLVVELVLRDLDEYFDQPDLRSRADDRVGAKARDHHGPVILIGHSMGSIVGYHALATSATPIGGLFGLVTFGSPLGLPSIYRRMKVLVPGTPMPASLVGWQNVWNEKDFATVEHALHRLFPARNGKPVVVDVQAQAGVPVPNDPFRGHDPLAYLKSDALAHAVMQLLLDAPPTGGDPGARRVPRRGREMGAVASVGDDAEPPIARAEPPGGGILFDDGIDRLLPDRWDEGEVVHVRPRREGQVPKAVRRERKPPRPAAPGARGAPPPTTRAARPPTSRATPPPSPPSRAARPPTSRAPRPSAAEAAAPALDVRASADFPPVVRPGSVHPLAIEVTTKDEVLFGAAVDLGPVPVEPGRPIQLRVGVHAPAFTISASDDKERWAVIELPTDRKASVTALFNLRALPATDRFATTIELTFFHHSTPIGEITIPVTIDPGLAVPKQGAFHLVRDRVPYPDLTFVVTDRSEGLRGAGPFDIRVSREGEYFERPLGEFQVSIAVVTEAQGLLSRFHDVADLLDANCQRAVERLGSYLWWMLPEDFRAFYWDEMDGRDLSIAIYSQEPYIPWELIVPQKRTGYAGYSEMLGMAFPIARWTQGLPFPSSVDAARLAVIAPEYGGDPLPFAQDEADELHRQYGAAVRPGALRSVRRTLGSGDFDIVHFSGHGRFDPQIVELSAIELADGSLTPDDLPRARRDGDERRPFVFLNACEVGQAGFGLSAMAGWAPEFCKRGFMGFVGPYWPVNDTIAGKAAQTFYKRIAEGDTVAEAVRAIRRRFMEDRHPSWLAYTIHCQPNVKLAVSSTGGHLAGRRLCARRPRHPRAPRCAGARRRGPPTRTLRDRDGCAR